MANSFIYLALASCNYEHTYEVRRTWGNVCTLLEKGILICLFVKICDLGLDFHKKNNYFKLKYKCVVK